MLWSTCNACGCYSRLTIPASFCSGFCCRWCWPYFGCTWGRRSWWGVAIQGWLKGTHAGTFDSSIWDSRPALLRTILSYSLCCCRRSRLVSPAAGCPIQSNLCIWDDIPNILDPVLGDVQNLDDLVIDLVVDVGKQPPHWLHHDGLIMVVI